MAGSVWCQSSSYDGRVTDIHGDGIEKAEVRCSDSKAVVGTIRGPGWLTVPQGSCSSGIVIISAEGFVPRQVDLNHDPAYRIVLEPAPVSATVQVTGLNTSILDTTASVAELDQRTLETSAALTLDDRLRQVPGFSLFRRAGSRTANPTTQGVSLRGIGASGASRALVLKDGVPLNDPFGGWVYWGRVPAEEISEVEIVRGPAGDLYGTAAVGGVIAVRTHKPDDFHARLDASYGNQHTPSWSAYASVPEGRWAYMFGLEKLRTDGFIPVAPADRGLVDTLAGVRRSAFTPRVSREIDEDRTVWLAGDFYRETRTNGTPLQTNATRIGQLTAGADLKWPDAGLYSIRVFGGTERYDQSFTAIAADRSSENLTRLQSVPSRMLGVKGQWSGQVRKFIGYAGGEARDIHGRSNETGFAAGRANVESSAGGREITVGLFAGGMYYITEKLFLSGGVRFDNWRNLAGSSTSRSLLAPTSTEVRFTDRSTSRISPRASLLYKASDRVSLTATVATGFRQPTLNELYRSFRVGNVLTLANEGLTAERAVDAEAAVIFNALGGRLYARTGPFCTRVDDTVANVTLSITPTLITRQRQNLGRTRTCGWEGDIDLRPTSSLTFSGGFLAATPRVVVGSTPALNGLLIAQVPRSTFSLQARYSRPRGTTASMQLRSVSRQFEDDQNQLTLAGYTAVDAFVSQYVRHNITAYAAAENLFDRKIEAGRTPVLTLGQPRTFRIGVRVRFGGE